MVKRVLALLKMEVRELMREANMTDSIRPRSPGREESSEWHTQHLSSFVLRNCEDSRFVCLLKLCHVLRFISPERLDIFRHELWL